MGGPAHFKWHSVALPAAHPARVHRQAAILQQHAGSLIGWCCRSQTNVIAHFCQPRTMRPPSCHSLPPLPMLGGASLHRTQPISSAVPEQRISTSIYHPAHPPPCLRASSGLTHCQTTCWAPAWAFYHLGMGKCAHVSQGRCFERRAACAPLKGPARRPPPAARVVP